MPLKLNFFNKIFLEEFYRLKQNGCSKLVKGCVPSTVYTLTFFYLVSCLLNKHMAG